MRREPGANAAREVQATLFEVADQDRVEVRGVWFVSADDELLTRTELNLDPRVAAFARDIEGILSFRYHAFEAQLPDFTLDVVRGAWQNIGQQHIRSANERLQTSASLLERYSKQRDVINRQEVEGV